ncbi:MAG: M28 family peptidase [Candidatus Marinimicrobia bacterium]|nr:M28 family peptidase [Candidatus Neomarinimicrobiota bacterium]
MHKPTLHLLIFTLLLHGQSSIPAGSLLNMEAAAVGLTTITARDLEAHVNFLASDVTAGRGTGQPGLQVAAEYIATQFHRLGLEPIGTDNSYFQKFELLKTRLTDNIGLVMIEKGADGWSREKFQYNEDFFVSPHGLTGSTETQAPIVFAGYGITAPNYDWDDYADADVERKAVLIIDGQPEIPGSDYFTGEAETHVGDVMEKVITARENGASAIVIAFNPRSEMLFSDRMKRWERWLTQDAMALPSPISPAPVFFINKRTANRLLSVLGKSLMQIQEEVETGISGSTILPGTNLLFSVELEKETVVTQNVVGYLSGTDPELNKEGIIFSAHYDHLGVDKEGTIWYGADDNGTGTSAILEIADAITSNPKRAKRSFLFLAIAGEEKGLLGSNYYTNHPLIPLEQTITNLNIDMIGRNAADSIYIIGSNMISQELHDMNEAAAGYLNNLGLNYRYNTLDDPNRFYYRSDHYNFAKRGIPVIFYFAGVHEDYHQPTDTRDKINFDKMERVAKLVYLTGWGMANRGGNIGEQNLNSEFQPEIPFHIKY